LWSQAYDHEGADLLSIEADVARAIAREIRARKGALTRATCSGRLLQEKAGEITVRWMMRVARDRSTKPSVDNKGTASSCVATLPTSHKDLPVFWWSASRPSKRLLRSVLCAWKPPS